MTANKEFIILLLLITITGLGLRLAHYDFIPPFTETADEFIYPWYGMSLLKTGVPTSWSNFSSYTSYQKVTYWGEKYRLVTPFIDKPPLFPLLTGSIMLAAGTDNFPEVRLATLRLIPITLSLFVIIVVGLLTRSLFNKQIGLLAAGLYATIPTIVMANRLSVTESLLTLISLFAIYFFIRHKKTTLRTSTIITLGILSGLATLTKYTGIFLPLAFTGIFFAQKKWKQLALFALTSSTLFAIYPLMAAYYDWGLFLNVAREFSSYHNRGLPEIVYAIFRLPLIGHPGGSFPDGAILASYILLFSSPFWLLQNTRRPQKHTLNLQLLLIFPLLYVVILGLMESGSYFFGWHLYPLFPFLVILLAKTMYDFWHRPDLLKALFFYLLLGSSIVRYSLALLPEFRSRWQLILALIFIFISTIFLLKKEHQRLIFAISLFVFFVVNIAVILFAPFLYPSEFQPPN